MFLFSGKRARAEFTESNAYIDTGVGNHKPRTIIHTHMLLFQ